ncbi:MAG: energy transducer TonB [Bryobacteraceae bacterium]|nr:energy transducer TonB [Bryobacteraceae bacterium]
MAAFLLTALAIAQPKARPRIRVGGTVQATRLKTSAPPEYPAAALAARVQGVVRLEVLIDTTGAVTQATVQSGPAQLTLAAREAVLRYKYTPTELNGQAAEVITVVDVRFTLPRKGP